MEQCPECGRHLVGTTDYDDMRRGVRTYRCGLCARSFEDADLAPAVPELQPQRRRPEYARTRSARPAARLW